MIPKLTIGQAGDITHCEWIVRRQSRVRTHVQLAALRQLYAPDARLKLVTTRLSS